MQTAPKKVINAWAMYDWSNSVYNLVITTTFFPIYFTAVTKKEFGSNLIPFLGRNFVNSSLYDYTLAAAYLIIALLYPILTSIADSRGNKKSFMQFFCYLGSLGCALLFFFNGSNLWLGILCFMMASMGYVGSVVFYNAYLPELAAPQDRDRISAKGFSYGYIGSVLMQLIGFALVVLMTDDPLLATRITFLLVGLWWAGFAQITFAGLPKTEKALQPGKDLFKSGFAEMRKIYQEVKTMPVLKRFLRGFFFYSMGVQTVMLAATLFGSKLLGLEDTKLIITVVIIQLVAIAGAIIMSRLSAKYGNLKVLMSVVVLWILICVAAYQIATFAEPLRPYHDQIETLKNKKASLLEQKTPGFESNVAETEREMAVVSSQLQPKQQPVEYGFYLLAIAVGLVMGGIQSLSRSTYSKLMPETKDTASYFSYYDLSEKIAIVVGMFSFGFIEEVTGSMKNSLLSLIVFFVLGLLWLFSAMKKQQKELQLIPV